MNVIYFGRMNESQTYMRVNESYTGGMNENVCIWQVTGIQNGCFMLNVAME